MKKIMMFATATAIALSSCSKNEATRELEGTPIGFDVYSGLVTGNTKADGSFVDGTDYPEGGSFKVFAYYTGANNFGGTTETPNFMFDQTVNRTGDSFTYTPIKYWPVNSGGAKITFAAYHPATAAPANLSLEESDETAAYTKTSVGLPVINFTVPSAINKQADLMYAVKENATNEPGSVLLTFNHALTQINFGAKLNKDVSKSVTKFEIISLKMKGDYHTAGKFSMQDKTWQLGEVSSTATTYSVADSVEIDLKGDPTSLTPTVDMKLLLLPQSVTTTFEIVYEITYESGATPLTSTVTKDVTTTWEQGESYTYTFEFDMENVAISAEVNEWVDKSDNQGTENVPVQLP